MVALTAEEYSHRVLNKALELESTALWVCLGLLCAAAMESHAPCVKYR